MGDADAAKSRSKQQEEHDGDQPDTQDDERYEELTLQQMPTSLASASYALTLQRPAGAKLAN